ncbi:MAG: uL15 family ribosomal protein, partial [Paracoccaceae bacterium]
SRSGVAIKGFEGGQMPIHMRLPKRGFNNINTKRHAVTNLANIQAFIAAGKLAAGQPLDEAALVACGLLRRVRDGVRILGRGELTTEGLQISVTGASKSAIAAVAAKGGALTVAAPAEAAAES